MHMLLESKTALIFGAGGAIGSQLARTFAREGATVFLSGPRLPAVDRVAAEIRSAGGTAHVAAVDALRDEDVVAYMEGVARETGGIDVVLNAMGAAGGGDHVAPSGELTTAKLLEYNAPVTSQFLTARVASRHMAARGRGVVIFVGATPARGVAPLIAGPSAAHAAIEGLTRCLATEWGPLGIRVVCIRSGGMPETRRIQSVLDGIARTVGVPKDALLEATVEKTLLKRMPTVAEFAEVAAFLASDGATAITGAIINNSCW